MTKQDGQILAASLATQYGYDLAGNLATITQPNGVKTTYTYNALNQLDLEEVKDASENLLARFDYTVRSDGQRAEVLETLKTSGGAFSTTRIRWEYDELNRLKQEERDEGDDGQADPGDYTDYFAFDLAGNRTSFSHQTQIAAVTADPQSSRLSLVEPDTTISTGTRLRLKAEGILPAELSDETDYYVIELDPTDGSFKLSTTLGGSAVDFTTSGTGTLQITIQDTAGRMDRTLRYVYNANDQLTIEGPDTNNDGQVDAATATHMG